MTLGTQKRDLIHVDDIVSIILAVMKKNFCGFVQLPVGTGEQHSIREIVEFLKKETGSSSRLEFGAVPQRKDEPDTLANVDWYNDASIVLKYSFFDGLRQECREITG